MVHLARRFATDEAGVTAVEYGILAAVLATLVIAAMPAVGHGVNHTARAVSNSLGGPQTLTSIHR